MTKSKFISQLEQLWQQNKFVCLGLDSDFSQLPESVKTGNSKKAAMVTFNQAIVDQTIDLACAYKLNSAFYEAEGEEGLAALKETIEYIKTQNPEMPVILDAKRGDIGNTNDAYIKAVFDNLKADAITVSPYLGQESLQSFLQCTDKGIIVLVKTSNPGSAEFQDLLIDEESLPSTSGEGKLRLYQTVAKHIAENWNTNGNCGIVVGATYPEELAKIREIVGDIPILIPGIGAQGGDLESTIKAGKDSRGWGMLIHSARGIIFASKGEDFAEAARKATEDLHNQIVEVLNAN